MSVSSLLKIIGNLTLEVYIVGFTLHLIPIEINKIFPFNIPIAISFVIVLALILKICTKIFLDIVFNHYMVQHSFSYNLYKSHLFWNNFFPVYNIHYRNHYNIFLQFYSVFF